MNQILEQDKAEGKNRRHTAKRIFERLRDERAYTGGYTIVKDHVRLRKPSQREMFMPLAHPPGDPAHPHPGRPMQNGHVESFTGRLRANV